MKNTKKLVYAAVLAALACAATLVIHVPSPTGGYMNLGDTVVILSSYLLGPWWGAAAAGIGSALADLISGAPLYIPATLLIKALMALCAALVYRALGRKSILAEAIMVLGYWFYDGMLMGSFLGAAAGLPSNLMQAVLGLAGSSALAFALLSSSYVKKEFPEL